MPYSSSSQSCIGERRARVDLEDADVEPRNEGEDRDGGERQEVSDDVATKKTTQAFREDLAFRKQWDLLSKSISGGDERVESRA